MSLNCTYVSHSKIRNALVRVRVRVRVDWIFDEARTGTIYIFLKCTLRHIGWHSTSLTSPSLWLRSQVHYTALHPAFTVLLRLFYPILLTLAHSCSSTCIARTRRSSPPPPPDQPRDATAARLLPALRLAAPRSAATSTSASCSTFCPPITRALLLFDICISALLYCTLLHLRFHRRVEICWGARNTGWQIVTRHIRFVLYFDIIIYLCWWWGTVLEKAIGSTCEIRQVQVVYCNVLY